MDYQGVPVVLSDSVDADMALGAVNNYIQSVLSYAPFSRWAEVVEAKKQATVEQCPMLSLLSADYFISTMNVEAATECLDKVEAAFGDALADREQAYLNAFKAWLGRDLMKAYEFYVELNKKFPLDLYACKRAQLMALLSGNNESILTCALAVEDANKGKRWFSGMLSFGYEQGEHFQQAEHVAKEASILDSNQDDAWLDHAYAHSLYFSGKERMDEAIKLLQAKSKQWSLKKIMPFLYSHNWWHLSLVLLEANRPDESLEIFDKVLWPVSSSLEHNEGFKKDLQVQLNAMQLLWRLDTRKLQEKTKPRWNDVLQAILGDDGLTKHHDLLFDVLLIRGLLSVGKVEEATILLDSISKDFVSKNPSLTDFATISKLVYTICDPSSDVDTQNKARDELLELRSIWTCLGNSTEQRTVLLELSTDKPVCCGSV